MNAVTRLHRSLAGRYEIHGEIGRGGSGTVFAATQLGHGRPVALKLLHPEVVARVGKERLLSVIRDAAALVHPHILPVYQWGEADGLVFYTMPLLHGESLRERLLYRGRLPVDEAVRIASAAAGALAYAHSQGVFHHGAKPTNLLLAANGHVWISDFGLARAVADAGRGSGDRGSEGLCPYASPEQAGGAEGDGRSDVFGLGCVLYEMLVGDPPPRTAPPSPAAARPEVPADVEQAVMRALAIDPRERFWSAAEFAAALRRKAEPGAVPGRTRAALLPAGAVAALALLALGLAGDGGSRPHTAGAEPSAVRVARPAPPPLASAYRSDQKLSPFDVLPSRLRPADLPRTSALAERVPGRGGAPATAPAGRDDRRSVLSRMVAAGRTLLSPVLDLAR